jgi:hypothetical protein
MLLSTAQSAPPPGVCASYAHEELRLGGGGGVDTSFSAVAAFCINGGAVPPSVSLASLSLAGGVASVHCMCSMYNKFLGHSLMHTHTLVVVCTSSGLRSEG